MTYPARIVSAVAAPDNDNTDPFELPAVEDLGVAAQSALWHIRTYGDLLRPRLAALAGDRALYARALAAQLAECIGCRRSVRCDACPVARAAGRL